MEKKQKIKKVIQIIWNIVSIIFVAFVSGALIINAISGADEKTQDIFTPNIQEVKHRSNAIKGNGRSASLTNEFISNDFLTTLCVVTNIITDYNTDNNNRAKTLFVGENTNHSPNELAYPLVTTMANVNFNDMTCGGTDDVNWIQLNSIYIYVNWKSYNNDLTLFYLTFHFRDILEDDIFHFSSLLSYYGQTFGLENSSFSFSAGSVAYDKTYLDPNFVVLYGNNKSLDNYLHAYANDNSYLRGYELGKQEGYYKGVVDGSNGIQTNAFTVIGQTFSAVGNILSIEVLPGFPLWILIFTPLIIAVVIVVVKMIKG